MKSGITFHKSSPYASICADVVVNDVNTIKNHSHSIPKKVSNNASALQEVSIGYN